MRHHMTESGPVPFTPEQEAEWDAMEAEARAEHHAATVAARKTAILAELESIDLKSIRALREGHRSRIDSLEAQAVALRLELAAL